jgi:transcriptional regulator with XRE-family HTH domain
MATPLSVYGMALDLVLRKRGVKRADIASVLGLRHQTISHHMRVRNPSLHTYARILNEIGCSWVEFGTEVDFQLQSRKHGTVESD